MSPNVRRNRFFLVLALLGFAGCGTGPQLDTSGMENEFPGGQNPIGLLEARGAKTKANPPNGQQLGYEYSAHQYCTAFLRSDGMILTQHECVSDTKNRKIVDTEELRAYFRRPKDTHTQEVKFKRVVVSTRINGESWIVLEPADRFILVDKYGGLKFGSHLAALGVAGSPATTPAAPATPDPTNPGESAETTPPAPPAPADIERVAEVQASVPVRLISIIPPGSDGVVKYSRGAGLVSAGEQIEEAVRNRARLILRENPPVGEVRPTPEEAERLARVHVMKNLGTTLGTTGRVSVKVLEKQEFTGHGGVTLFNGEVIAILPKSGRKDPNRTESALRTGELAL